MIAFTAGVLVGAALAAFAALALAYYLDRREQMASMRRHSAMTAALSGMGTPRPPATGGVIKATDAKPDVASTGDARAARIWTDERGTHIEMEFGVYGVKPYLPESRDADFQP